MDQISKELFTDHPDLTDTMKDHGWNLLQCASYAGRDDLVTQILSTNPLVDEATTEGALTALEIAFNEKHENVVLRILEMCPSQASRVINSDGFTVLHVAISEGFRAVVEHLATNPAMINAITNEGHTTLHMAAESGDSATFSLVLAANPALIDATTNDGCTVLHFAASEGHTSLVSFLLSNNAKLTNAVINNGRTAMHCAAENGHLSVVKLLHTVSPGLIHVTPANGMNAVHLAIIRGRSAVALYLLAEAPTLVNATDNLGRTPLYLAAGAGLTEVVAHILAVDASLTIDTLLAVKPELISIKEEEGNTPLHVLVEFCSFQEIIEAMWRAYPEALRAPNNDNDTPFHRAVAKSNDPAIDLFQWELTWEEIKSAYDKCETSYVERFKPVMETQCEALSEVLLPDLAETVFEYLDFERVKRLKSTKRKASRPLHTPLGGPLKNGGKKRAVRRRHRKEKG